MVKAEQVGSSVVQLELGAKTNVVGHFLLRVGPLVSQDAWSLGR